MIGKLKNRITNSNVKIGVLGAGYVGLPLAVEISKRNSVVIFDIDTERINELKKKHSYIDDVSSSEIDNAISQGTLVPSNDEKVLGGLDCYFICVPTPLYKDSHIPDLSSIIQAALLVANSITNSALVILESTSYPGTTEEIVKPIFEKKGLVLDKDYCLSFSPERVDPGNKYFDAANTCKVVGGCTELSTALTVELLKSTLGCEVFTVSSPNVAEMAKVLENSYRNVNIGLVNEFAMICNHMNIDIWEVIEAAKTKPFGFHAFYPGPGVGGHCIPIDPVYLSYKAKETGIDTPLIDTSQKILDYMPTYVVNRVEQIIEKRIHKTIENTKILVVGVAYKSNINDSRESPAIKVIGRLLQKGSKVSYYDPHVAKIVVADKTMISITEAIVRSNFYDLILITTNHSDIDYYQLITSGTVIFDTRNAMRGLSNKSIIKL